MINHRSKAILKTLTPRHQKAKVDKAQSKPDQERKNPDRAKKNASIGTAYNKSTNNKSNEGPSVFIMKPSEVGKVSEMSDVTRGLLVSALHSGQMEFERGAQSVISNMFSNRNKSMSYMAYKNQSNREQFIIDHSQITPSYVSSGHAKFQVGSAMDDLPEDPQKIEEGRLAGGAAPDLPISHHQTSSKFQTKQIHPGHTQRSKSTLNTFEAKKPIPTTSARRDAFQNGAAGLSCRQQQSSKQSNKQLHFPTIKNDTA